MNRDFLLNLAFLIGINLLIKPLYILGIDVTVQNVVGENYGLYFALLNFTYLMQIVGDLGIQQFNNRRIAQDSSALKSLFPSLFAAKLFLVIPYLLVAIIFTITLGYLSEWKLLGLILINQSLVSFALFMRSNISGLGMYRWDSILSVLDKLFMIVVCGIFLFVPSLKGSFTIFSFVFIQFFSFLFVILIAGYLLRKHRIFSSFSINRSQLVDLVKKSLPFGLAVFLMTLYTRVDAVMIERLLPDGVYESSVYAAGYRLLDAANMLAFLFPPLLLPMFSKLQKQKKALGSLLQLSFSWMWVIIVLVTICGYLYRQQVMDLLYTGADTYWGNVFGILICNFIWMGLIYVFGTFVTASGKMRTANLIYFSCIVLNISLNWYLIPIYKAWGAAITTLFTHAAVVLGLMYIIREQLFQRAFLGTAARAILFSAVSLGIGYALNSYAGLGWFVSMTITILLCLLFALLIKLIDLRVLWHDFSQSKAEE